MEEKELDEAVQLLRAAIRAHADGLYYVASSLASAYVRDMEGVLRRIREQNARD